MNEAWKRIATTTQRLLGLSTLEERLADIQGTLKDMLGMEHVAFFPVERPFEELNDKSRNRLPFFEYLALQRCLISVDVEDQDVLPPELDGWRYPTLLFVPLIVRDFVLGVLALASSSHREFTDEESKQIEALISQLSTIIDAQVLLRKFQRRNIFQKVLQELDLEIGQGQRVTSIAKTSQVAQGLLEVERTLIFTGKESLKITAAQGCPYASQGCLSTEPCAKVAEEACAKRTTLVYNQEAIAKLGQMHEKCQERQVMAVPISIRGRNYGSLVVFNKRDGKDFDSNDLQVGEQLAGRLAMALSNDELLEQVQQAGLSSIKSLAAALDAKDNYTCNHSQNVARYSFLIAQEMRLPVDFCNQLHLAGLIHDIGKIGVPDEVLNKVEKLSNEEFDLLKMHPATGATILAPFPNLSEVMGMMYTHHEKYDGRGYPRGVKGNDIPLGGRILCVADSFDAMSSDRKYRGRRPILDVLREVQRCSGSQFDPEIVKAFFKAYAGMGTLDLNSNEIPSLEEMAEFF